MKINIKKEKSGILIELEGVWDMAASEDFVRTCTSSIKKDGNVIIDLSKVEYIYISGLRQILYIQYLATMKRTKLKVINVDERTYKKLLELNYIERMDIVTKVEEQS